MHITSLRFLLMHLKMIYLLLYFPLHCLIYVAGFNRSTAADTLHSGQVTVGRLHECTKLCIRKL